MSCELGEFCPNYLQWTDEIGSIVKKLNARIEECNKEIEKMRAFLLRHEESTFAQKIGNERLYEMLDKREAYEEVLSWL